MSNTLNYRLLSGLTEEEKDLIEKAYTISKPLLDKLVSVLRKDLERSTMEGDDSSKFETPNWELYQAFLTGQRNAFRTIINLLTKKDKVDHDL